MQARNKDPKRIAAIASRISDGHVDAKGWPVALGARGTCTADEVREAYALLRMPWPSDPARCQKFSTAWGQQRSLPVGHAGKHEISERRLPPGV